MNLDESPRVFGSLTMKRFLRFLCLMILVSLAISPGFAQTNKA